MVAKSKSFDCVEMKREIQERIERDSEGLSTRELAAEHARIAAEFSRSTKAAARDADEPAGFSAFFAAIDRGQVHVRRP